MYPPDIPYLSLSPRTIPTAGHQPFCTYNPPSPAVTQSSQDGEKTSASATASGVQLSVTFPLHSVTHHSHSNPHPPYDSLPGHIRSGRHIQPYRSPAMSNPRCPPTHGETTQTDHGEGSQAVSARIHWSHALFWLCGRYAGWG